jgi:hypothetical protein
LRPYFGDNLFSAITPAIIVAFQTTLRSLGKQAEPGATSGKPQESLGRRTRRNIDAVLARMFNLAAELELIPRNPSSAARHES